MNPELEFIFTVTIVAICLMTLISGKPKSRSEPEPKKKRKTKQKSDEVIDTLDWMLANQIITASEYNKLIVKCLPFLE